MNKTVSRRPLRMGDGSGGAVAALHESEQEREDKNIFSTYTVGAWEAIMEYCMLLVSWTQIRKP